MTSKISFSKLVRENLRHQMGAILLTVFTFLMYLMYDVMIMQNAIGDDSMTAAEILEKINWLAEPNVVWGLFLFALGGILGAGGFFYLHSRSKVDFRHSLPVRRGTMYAAQIASSLLVFVLPLLLAMTVQCILAAAVGYGSLGFVQTTASAALVYLLVFAMAWVTAALAMVMTGHPVVGGLGFLVFVSYVPVIVRYIFPAYAFAFFKTYAAGGEWGQWANNFSPFSLCVKLTGAEEIWTWAGHGGTVIASLAWIAVFGSLSAYLYRIRRSEMAGRAMAFPRMNPVIRILLVVPLALYSGFFLQQLTLQASTLWMVVGIVGGTIVFHGVIESIYKFDVRGMWSKRVPMFLTMAASLLVMLSFRFDVFGYDRTIPSSDKVESVLAVIDGMSSGTDYVDASGTTKTVRPGLTGEQKEEMLALIGDISKVIDSSGEDSLTVTYQMKDGSQKKRCYSFTMDDEILSRFDALFATKEYKEGIYDIYQVEGKEIDTFLWSNPVDSLSLSLTEEERETFRQIYLSELDALTYTQMTEELPLGQIDYYGEASGTSNDLLYIYPEFTETIAFLKEKGCDADKSLADYPVTAITLTYYTNEGEETKNITDPAAIEQIKPYLIPDDLMSAPVYDSYWNWSGSATVRTASGNVQMYCSLAVDGEAYLK